MIVVKRVSFVFWETVGKILETISVSQKTILIMQFVTAVFLRSKYRFAVSFQGIRRQGCVFFFRRWLKLAHIYIQVTSLHKGEKQANQSAVLFIRNRFQCTLRILRPKILSTWIVENFETKTWMFGTEIHDQEIRQLVTPD